MEWARNQARGPENRRPVGNRRSWHRRISGQRFCSLLISFSDLFHCYFTYCFSIRNRRFFIMLPICPGENFIIKFAAYYNFLIFINKSSGNIIF